jgi:hypothetical protein
MLARRVYNDLESIAPITTGESMPAQEEDWMSEPDADDELIASAMVQALLSEQLSKVTAQIIEAQMQNAPQDVVAALIAEQQDIKKQLNPLSERIAELDARLSHRD